MRAESRGLQDGGISSGGLPFAYRGYARSKSMGRRVGNSPGCSCPQAVIQNCPTYQAYLLRPVLDWRLGLIHYV